MKYDYIVKRNGDINNIEFELNGHDKIEIDINGNLNVYIRGSIIKFKKPYIYQEIEKKKNKFKFKKPYIYQEVDRKIVDIYGSFVLEDDKVFFNILDYEKNYDLIINIDLIYESYLEENEHNIFQGKKNYALTRQSNEVGIDTQEEIYIEDVILNNIIKEPYEPYIKEIKNIKSKIYILSQEVVEIGPNLEKKLIINYIVKSHIGYSSVYDNTIYTMPSKSMRSKSVVVLEDTPLDKKFDIDISISHERAYIENYTNIYINTVVYIYINTVVSIYVD